MIPNQQQGQQQGGQQPDPMFTQDHHNAYEAMRGIAMKFLQMGVPGMDQVLGAISNTHAKQLAKSRLATPGGYNPGVSMGQLGQQIGQGLGQAAHQVVGGVPSAFAAGAQQAQHAGQNIGQAVNPYLQAWEKMVTPQRNPQEAQMANPYQQGQ